MLQLFEIQFALKLRRKGMVSLWKERSILLGNVILLMPSLMKTLQPRKHLTMNSLHIPRFVVPVLVLPPMPIYLDLRKNFCYGTGNLGSACIRSRRSCILSRLMNPLVFAMKCLLSSHPIFTSTPNLKTPPLCQSCQLARSKHRVPKVNQPMKARQDQEGALSWDAYEDGDFVSAHQYVVNTPGRLLSGYGREAPHNQLC